MKINQTVQNRSDKVPSGKGMKFAVILSKFNDKYGEPLLNSTIKHLQELNTEPEGIKIFKVPGALELPIAANIIAKKKSFDAIIALGVVIKGETYHFELVSEQAHSGLMRVSLDHDIPVIFGILTAFNEKQVKERISPEKLDKGLEFARTAVEIVTTIKQTIK